MSHAGDDCRYKEEQSLWDVMWEPWSVETLALKSQSRRSIGAFSGMPRPTLLRYSQSTNMADDEKETRATTLASQALELVASGRDEVRRCLCGVYYNR